MPVFPHLLIDFLILRMKAQGTEEEMPGALWRVSVLHLTLSSHYPQSCKHYAIILFLAICYDISYTSKVNEYERYIE